MLEPPRTLRGEAPAPPRDRIHALDMTKGFLVICMVVYHSFNYSQDYSLGFLLLPFLPPSFILITGFLLAKVYERAPSGTSSFRASLRGVRLLILFTILNILAQSAGRHHVGTETQGLGYFFEHWDEVYLTGEGRLAAFEVLLPISYLLILAPVILFLDRINRFLLPLLTLVMIVYSATLERTGDQSANLHLLTAGLLGFVLGHLKLSTVTKAGRVCWLWIVSYGLYLYAVRYLGQVALMQLTGACLALMFFFSVSLLLGTKNLLARELIKLGKYSLFAYIAQIALLQLFVRFFGRFLPYSSRFFLQMSLVLILMVVMVEALEWTRRRATWMDRSYRFFFA